MRALSLRYVLTLVCLALLTSSGCLYFLIPAQYFCYISVDDVSCPESTAVLSDGVFTIGIQSAPNSVEIEVPEGATTLRLTAKAVLEFIFIEGEAETVEVTNAFQAESGLGIEVRAEQLERLLVTQPGAGAKLITYSTNLQSIDVDAAHLNLDVSLAANLNAAVALRFHDTPLRSAAFRLDADLHPPNALTIQFVEDVAARLQDDDKATVSIVGYAEPWREFFSSDLVEIVERPY